MTLSSERNRDSSSVSCLTSIETDEYGSKNRICLAKQYAVGGWTLHPRALLLVLVTIKRESAKKDSNIRGEEKFVVRECVE